MGKAEYCKWGVTESYFPESIGSVNGRESRRGIGGGEVGQTHRWEYAASHHLSPECNINRRIYNNLTLSLMLNYSLLRYWPTCSALASWST